MNRLTTITLAVLLPGVARGAVRPRQWLVLLLPWYLAEALVRALTESGRHAIVAAMAAAMDKAAQSAEFKKYLADELAFADSYIPAAKAGPFLAEQLALIDANMPRS